MVVDGIVTVRFAAGTNLPSSMMLPISIQSDEILEGDESFTVSVVEVFDEAGDFTVVDSNVDPLTLTITDAIDGKFPRRMAVKCMHNVTSPHALSLSVASALTLQFMPQNGEFSESGTDSETVVVSITTAPVGGIDTGGNGIEFSLIFAGDAGKYIDMWHLTHDLRGISLMSWYQLLTGAQ